MNYSELSKTFVSGLGVRNPVAIALCRTVPKDMVRLDKPTRHCQMITKAMDEGAQFYTLEADHACKGGAAALGLREMEPVLRSGEFYFKLKGFKTQDAAKQTMDRIPLLEPGSTKAVLYAPLEKATFEPDVIVTMATPRQAMQIVQALLYEEGGRVESGFSGRQSLCADCVAEPSRTKKLGISVGCSGSRKNAGIKDSEMIIGIPFALFPALVRSAAQMFASG